MHNRFRRRDAADKKSKSMLSKIMVPMLILALMQISVFGVLLLLNGGFSYIKSHSYNLVTEKTENRKTYLENMFSQKTALVYETANTVTERVEKILEQERLTAEDVKKNKELNKRILAENADLLISLIRRDMVNDAFIILDSGTLYDSGEKKWRTGIYLRDTDVKENSISDNKDIYMEMGSSETARDFGLALDFEWSVYLDVSDTDSGNYDFFYEPIRTYALNTRTPLYNIGYWSGFSAISESQQGSIKYTMPLVDKAGRVYGVIGIGLMEKTIQQSIPSSDFLSDASCYILGLDADAVGEYRQVMHRGTSYGRLVDPDAVFNTQKRIEYDLYDFGTHNGTKVIGSIQELNMYHSGSPYRGQKWALIMAADKQMVLNTYYALSRVMMISMLVSLGISVIAAVFLSRRINAPVARMVKTLNVDEDNSDPIRFHSSGITEIDALADSIEELQARVTEYASRVSRIITASGSGIGVFMCDCDSKSVFVGESLIGLLGFKKLPNRDVTIPLEEFEEQMHTVDQDDVIMKLPIFAKGESGEQSLTDSREMQYTDRGGHAVWLKFTLTREHANVLGLVQDITGTVAEKREIEKVKDDEYTGRLIEANDALRAAYAAATQANHAKTDFLSRMSHDIRTPMNAIIGMTEIAQNHLDDKEKLADCFEKITVSSRYLLSLINEVLDMSKIEGGKLALEKETIHIPKMADNLHELMRPAIREKGHTFVMQIDDMAHEHVIGDSLRIRQVLMNILSNAVKYTPEGGHIEFHITEKETGQEKIGCYEFVISDNGKGMRPEFLDKLFSPFEREEDERVSKEQGTGLGMTIAYNIVRMMNGDIKVQSSPGKGSTFTVVLYLPFDSTATAAEAETDVKAAQIAERADFSGCRVLLVDDNELNREIAEEILGMANLEVESASNGKEALDKFAKSEPGYYDMILMDVQMPVMNGYEATRLIRSLTREDARKIPIVAMTANAFAEDVRAAKDAGMNGHIAKPLDMNKLFEMLGGWIGKKEQTEEQGT